MIHSKQSYRTYLRHKREKISLGRRFNASQAALNCLTSMAERASHILSYASFGTELDLWSLNWQLAEQGKLILPKIDQGQLSLFKVRQLDDLQLNQWGILEPHPLLCEQVDIPSLSLAFIPGLGFDYQTGHRLGYGKGYYDRLLKQFSSQAEAIGIGFKEQAVDDLPFSSQDVPLSQHLLF